MRNPNRIMRVGLRFSRTFSSSYSKSQGLSSVGASVGCSLVSATAEAEKAGAGAVEGRSGILGSPLVSMERSGLSSMTNCMAI